MCILYHQCILCIELSIGDIYLRNGSASAVREAVRMHLETAPFRENERKRNRNRFFLLSISCRRSLKPLSRTG
ncbi:MULTISPECIES: hypothetical protein [Planktothricoides]|uniref:Uncharacterized protein n=1 Tax=Planktothricoides raciborskii FACHB-1370 TaxID=2949576 RepID=A0ABR8ECS4_9CYAN|nr:MULTISPECIES: hypothetical protein [Planktothricoides]MBD2543944.1 hypothetical protein [Planktothricoides raciborskii FACHB-1370]MBD2582931.1 hypothetical protein [Planktothricoides raciborskii FACHB-1261]